MSKKTDDNIHGITFVNTIPIDKPCLVILGGELTVSRRFANGYASTFEKLIKYYKITDLDIYSACYDFEKHSTDRKHERKNAFADARARIQHPTPLKYAVDTQYIQNLYDILIRPRIADANDKKYSDGQAKKNMRNLILYTHCHGSAPVYAFQDIMKKDMKRLGYDTQAIYDIMKSLLVVQHAPVMPLEKQFFNTVSFMSANDTYMNFQNIFSEYVAENNSDLVPSYFSAGNFFVTHAFTPHYIAEHQIIGLVPDKEQDMLTPDGAIIMAAERNTIINGIKATQAGLDMPKLSDLISPASLNDPVKPDFDLLNNNGKNFIKSMMQDLRIKKQNDR